MQLRAAFRTAAGDAATDRVMRNAIGGLQVSMAEAIAIFCPNANGFRRFADGGIARNKRWGLDNPAALLNLTRADLRIEHRLASADANPYLVLAAALAGMHRGVEEDLDPGQPIDGSAARLVDQTMPFAIDAALVALENGSILREYLGPAYVDLYCVTKRAELERFRNHIPAHEYDWYM
jgi:glutamine synthetase